MNRERERERQGDGPEERGTAKEQVVDRKRDSIWKEERMRLR